MILKENFIDTYHNLTYKGVAALRWIDDYCSHATFVLKTDDDIFVNMFSLLRLLKIMTRQAPRRPNGLLMCCVWDGMPVQRSGKWKVCTYSGLEAGGSEGSMNRALQSIERDDSRTRQEINSYSHTRDEMNMVHLHSAQQTRFSIAREVI